MADHYGKLYGAEFGWNLVIWSILGVTLVSIILLAFTWNIKPKA